MGNRNHIFILLILLLQGCGGDHSSEDIPQPDVSPGITIPSTGNNGSTGGSDSSGIGGGGGANTATQGIKFLKNQSISMPTDETYQGATSDGASLYFLTEKYLTYPSKIRKIYKIDPTSGNKSLHCSWIDSDYIAGGLLVVGSVFYIRKASFSNDFKRLSVSGCNEMSTVTAVSAPLYYSPPAMAFDGNHFYWKGQPGGWGYPYVLERLTLDLNTVSTEVPETIVGDYTTDWGNLKALAALSGVKYAVFSPSYRAYTLWRFSGGNAKVTVLDSSLINSSSDPTQAAMLGSNTLVLFMSEYYNLKITYFDVADF